MQDTKDAQSEGLWKDDLRMIKKIFYSRIALTEFPEFKSRKQHGDGFRNG